MPCAISDAAFSLATGVELHPGTQPAGLRNGHNTVHFQMSKQCKSFSAGRTPQALHKFVNVGKEEDDMPSQSLWPLKATVLQMLL